MVGMNGQAVIDVRGVSQRVRTGQFTLRDIWLTVGRGELVAIIGGSGAGKTTLLDVMSGLRPPATGEVHRDHRAHGYVPQDDIIHLSLPLRRTLRYTAALRQADGVEDALRVLELTGRAAVPVGSLSGGERKRASIAAELLTRPGVFFLDEPTSGLDPARGAELMQALRRLAEDGTTVVLTTHNPLDAERCDKVAVLAGGYLAFYGTPAQTRAYFGTGSIAEVYQRLAAGQDAGEWGRTFQSRRAGGEEAGRAGADGEGSGREEAGREGGGAAAPSRPRPQRLGHFRQWALLTKRNADILARSKLTLAILLGSPVMVLAMFVILFRPHAFDPAHPSPEATVMIAFWLAFGGFFFGLTYGLLQICTEFAVLRRERFTGLRAGPYVLAKAAVLLRLLGRLPAHGGYGAMFVTLVLSSAAALALGLLISAAVTEPSQATIAMPMVCFPQVLFVGAILPVPVMAAAGQWVSYAMSNRWAFEGLGHSLGLDPLWAAGGSPLGRPLLASYGSTFAHPVVTDWLILGGFTVAFLAATQLVVLRRTSAAQARG
jgi:ABC-type multidrug transport system ATPase subunit